MKRKYGLYYKLVGLIFIFITLSCQEKRTKPLIGISFETLQTEYWVVSIDAIKASCKAKGYDYIEAVANGDANRQFEQINNFIALGVEGIVIAPKDANTVIPIIKAANRADIPIALYNRMPAKNKGKSTSVVADNYEITLATVKYLCELAKAKNKKHKAMILIGDLGDINAVYRRKGFDDAIAQYKDHVELVAEVPTEWNQEKALAGVTNALQAHPDIDLIFTSSDFLFPSLTSALKNAGKYHKIGHPDHVIMGGFDGDGMAYKLLKEKYLDADGVQDVFFECQAAVDAVIDAKKTNTMKPIITDPGFVIHQGNMDTFSSKMWGASIKN
jgi:ABC-type sugar transport system substrate-binding protein